MGCRGWGLVTQNTVSKYAYFMMLVIAPDVGSGAEMMCIQSNSRILLRGTLLLEL